MNTLAESHHDHIEPVNTDHINRISELIKNVGIPIVAMIVLGWFSWETVQWERERMLPAIERNNLLMERNSSLLEIMLKRIGEPVPPKVANE